MSADGGGYSFAAAPDPEELSRFELNDFGNAMRFARAVGCTIEGDDQVDTSSATLLYIREVGWIGFNGRHWDQKLGQRLAERTAHKVAQGLFAQAAIWIERKTYDAKTAWSFARTAGNAGSIASMLRVAEAYLQVDLDDFDRDPLVLTVRNCTLRFYRESGGGLRVERRSHDSRDRITRMAEVEYDPKASCPVWTATLKRWQPAEPMRGYLQRVAGYAFTGYTHEQAFFVFQGKGRDGKSTYVGALRELGGGYADVADVRTFLDAGPRDGAGASPDLARLAGDCRLVSVAEPPRGAKLNEGMIKSFTGGTPILARRLRQDLFSFTPKPKVILECNSRPVIRGDDEGIWRRIRLVMWEHQVPKGEVDVTLPAKLRAEFPGILNWIIQGIGDYLAEGLAEPVHVSDAMDDYRKGSSPFGEWFLDCVEPAEGVKTPAAFFYSSYKDWCEAQGIERPMSQTSFGNALADRQVIRAGKDPAGRVLRIGAKLREREAPMVSGSASATSGVEGDLGDPFEGPR